jgi:diguanylate cyclase (GGDEF)-like protein
MAWSPAIKNNPGQRKQDEHFTERGVLEQPQDRLDEYIDAIELVSGLLRRHPFVVLPGMVLLTLMIGWGDYQTGFASIAPFYLLPVTVACWVFGTGAGVGLAMLAAVANIVAEWAIFSSRMGIPNWLSVWNGMARMVIYLVFALILSGFHKRLTRERRVARIDPHTGLANARAFYERIEGEIEKAEALGLPLSVFFIDLDNFKRVNDEKGHAVGDRLLAQIGHAASGMLGDGGFIARFGGDEFIVVMTGRDGPASLQAAHDMVSALKSATRTFDIPQTYSVGVYTAMPPLPSGVDLLKKADALMYQAKENGKDRIEHGHS